MAKRGCVERIGDASLRNPITGIAPCCGRAASGQATDTLPRSVMKSRRLMGVNPKAKDHGSSIAGQARAPQQNRPLMSEMGLVSRALPVHTARRNCTGDEGGPFEFGNQVLISSYRKLLSSKAMVVNVAETLGHDPSRHG